MSISNPYPPGWGVPQVKTGIPPLGTMSQVKRQAELYRAAFHSDTTYEYLYRYPNRPLDWLLTEGYGLRRGAAFRAKKKVFEQFKVIADINKRHPALAAEQRVQGAASESDIAGYMKRRREAWRRHRDLNWGFYFGRG